MERRDVLGVGTSGLGIATSEPEMKLSELEPQKETQKHLLVTVAYTSRPAMCQRPGNVSLKSCGCRVEVDARWKLGCFPLYCPE